MEYAPWVKSPGVTSLKLQDSLSNCLLFACVIKIFLSCQFAGIADATTRHIASLVARQKKSPPKRKTRLTTCRPESEPVVPHFIRTQIKELLSGYPSGLLGSMFSLAFHRRFGQELSYGKLRFKSLGHLLESMSDIVRIEDMRGGGYRVYGKTNDKVNLGMLNAVDFSLP